MPPSALPSDSIFTRSVLVSCNNAAENSTFMEGVSDPPEYRVNMRLDISRANASCMARDWGLPRFMPGYYAARTPLYNNAAQGAKMTSTERREARYHRQKAKREAKRLKLLKKYNFEAVADLDNLYKALKNSRRGVWWKASVQRYDMNYLRRLLQARKDLLAGNDIRKGFYKFTTKERGKLRYIQSVHIAERVIQKSFCTNALVPLLTRTLIYDNGASIKGKGTHFALNRVKKHLQAHHKQHGTEGYVLLIDYSSYFANIQHNVLLGIYRRAFGEDKRLMWLAELFVKAFGDNGLGLGSENSQTSAVAYTNGIDHYIKETLRLVYLHYMDDNLFICSQKRAASHTLNVLRPLYEECGIITKPEKTKIIKLSQGFTFIKAKISLTDTGRVIMRPSRKSITRQRQKLRKFKKLHEAGEMTLEQIRAGYISCRGYMAHFQSRRTIRNLDTLYTRLFGIHPLEKI